MALKDEAKQVVGSLFGPINAERVDALDDSDPKAFLGEVKKIIEAMLGPTAADKQMQPLYSKKLGINIFHL